MIIKMQNEMLVLMEHWNKGTGNYSSKDLTMKNCKQTNGKIIKKTAGGLK